MEDIIIIGGGPAGLTAAVYVERAGKHALVFEGNVCGGQIVNAAKVENYPSIQEISGAEFAINLYNQAKNLGAEIKFEKVVAIRNDQNCKIVTTNLGEYKAKAVILATGASNRKLGLVNEKDFIGKGVSYCATCDGAFYRGKDVAVVGGGNTALEDALFLSNYCKKVYVVHRREEFRAENQFITDAKNKQNIEFITNANVTALVGKNKLEQIEITIANERKQTLSVNGLFVAIGQVPDSGIFGNVVKLDDHGYIVATEDCKTNVDGIFVAGDARVKTVRQLTTACGDGSVAALAAVNYVRNK